MQVGTVFWITGMSGVGKTTIANHLIAKLKANDLPTILLDGDMLRNALYSSVGYTIEERKSLALSYAKLCELIANQGINVICATISLFHDVHAWNRNNISHYYEVYIRAPIEDIMARDPKKIYFNASTIENKSIVGLDLMMEEPLNPDVIIDNDDKTSPIIAADRIFNHYCNSQKSE